MFRLILKWASLAGTATVLGTLTLAAGCTHQAPPEPGPAVSEASVPEFFEHRISYSGETLAVIAKHYTGRSQTWNEILQANPGLRPERMRIGQVVRIPRRLLVTEAPLPKKFVKAGPSKPEQQPIAVETPGEAPAVARPEGAESMGAIQESNVGESPVVQPSANPVTPIGAVVPDAAPAEPVKPAANPADAEREKLLDELLKQ